MQSYSLENLPDIIPIFPLPGVLLLPSGKLPLNVFEPRYLSMVQDALRTDWIIGMIQPIYTDGGANSALYPVGCAGKIVSFSETDDGRFLITLGGLLRFKTETELPLRHGYRRFQVTWEPFQQDLQRIAEPDIDRDHFESVLQDYLKANKISVKWNDIKKTSNSLLVTSLAMQCPFTREEKQALLEAPTLAELTKLMISLLKIDSLSNISSSASRH